jgi:hypothetical protein
VPTASSAASVPQIAQTIVHLGVDLNSVITKATLADAFAIALQRLGMGVRRSRSSADAARHDPRKTRSRGTHPDPEDGRLSPGVDPGRHARSLAMQLQDDLTRESPRPARAAC